MVKLVKFKFFYKKNNMSLINNMFNLQQILNDNTNGNIWITGKTKENRNISWYRCIYMEASEAIDSFNWKHWKDINSANDINNAKVEIIDIWHFIMSQAIINNQQQYAEKYENTNKLPLSTTTIIQNLEKIINLSSSASSIKDIIDVFFICLNNLSMDTADLYAGYIVKNQLNKFRQDNGYKSGKYKKVWGKVEDNVVAFNIVQKKPHISASQLYQELTNQYNKYN